MRVGVSQSAHSGESTQTQIQIETIDDYERATRRVAALDSASRGEAEDRERAALVEAIAAWDRRFDDASGWTDAS